MAEIRFDTGEERWDLNGRCQVGFNPTDMEFAARLCEAFARLEALYGGFPGPEESPFARAREMDREARAVLDGLFGAPVCEPLFGETSVFALAQGLPLWCGLLLAVMDVIREAAGARPEETNPRLAAYMARYGR